MTDYFLERWYLMVEEADDEELRSVRAAESRGHCIGYFRFTFFDPAAGKRFSEEQVRDYVDQFIEEVASARVLIKPGQSGFARFAGMWARHPADETPSMEDYLG